jgi:hypothetical protein
VGDHRDAHGPELLGRGQRGRDAGFAEHVGTHEHRALAEIVGDGPALDLVEVTHDDGRPRRMQPARGRRTEPPGTPGDERDGTVDDHADLLDVWTADGPRGRTIQTQPF